MQKRVEELNHIYHDTQGNIVLPNSTLLCLSLQNPRFLNLHTKTSALDRLDQIILVSGNCPVHCGIFSIFPGLRR